MKETRISTLQLVLAVSRCYSSYTLFSDYILWSIILAFVSEYRLPNFDQLSLLSEIPQKTGVRFACSWSEKVFICCDHLY